MSENCVEIKKKLESTYDLPFSVKYFLEYKDPVYTISPENAGNELFEVKILHRQNIRMIIEIVPQKYAANFIDEMQCADENKKKIFLSYIHLLKEKEAKVELFINDAIVNPEHNVIWNEKWIKFRFRATKITVGLEENEELDDTIEWANLSIGMILSLLNIEYNNNEIDQYVEGKVSQVLSNRYERTPVNRQLCLAANGYKCKICGFDFEKIYGEVGHEFIHVHHIEMVSSFGGEYFLNPQKDLIPVCPNCHAMLHRTNPPIMPEELKRILEKNKEKQ